LCTYDSMNMVLSCSWTDLKVFPSTLEKLYCNPNKEDANEHLLVSLKFYQNEEPYMSEDKKKILTRT